MPVLFHSPEYCLNIHVALSFHLEEILFLTRLKWGYILSLYITFGYPAVLKISNSLTVALNGVWFVWFRLANTLASTSSLFWRPSLRSTWLSLEASSTPASFRRQRRFLELRIEYPATKFSHTIKACFGYLVLRLMPKSFASPCACADVFINLRIGLSVYFKSLISRTGNCDWWEFRSGSVRFGQWRNKDFSASWKAYWWDLPLERGLWPHFIKLTWVSNEKFRYINSHNKTSILKKF